MKKVALIAIIAFSILLLVSCESQNIKEAKKAFENKEYASVVNKLSYEENLNDDAITILTVSQAQIAYENKEYYKVINLLSTIPDGKSNEIYEQAIMDAIDHFIQTSDAEDVKKIITIDEEAEDKLSKKIMDGCNQLDYKYYKLLDILTETLSDSETKNVLIEFQQENRLNRAKAFMIGDWEWQKNDEKNTIVKNRLVGDGLLGTVAQVGTNEIEYQIALNDIYWKDYVFIDETNFTCYNLTKMKTGNVVDVTAIGVIDYANEAINLHLTAPAPYFMVDADRTWKRLNK